MWEDFDKTLQRSQKHKMTPSKQKPLVKQFAQSQSSFRSNKDLLCVNSTKTYVQLIL